MLFVSILVIAKLVVAYHNPHYVKGRDTMVHLFEWKWSDVANECERFLGPIGFGGIQVSPIQENVIVPNRPWWERYQPISYKWQTRSGDENDFKNMVRRCNNVGVRIYVDVILNHMSGNQPTNLGTGGSTADTKHLYYPSVPYMSNNFHPKCEVNNYTNPENVRNCELVGLHDLDQSQEYVRNKMIDFMNAAIDAGVAGFRIDAAKHMWPLDLKQIYSKLKNLRQDHGFSEGSRPFIFQEVIDYGSEAISKREYSKMAVVTEFKYGSELSNAFKGNNPLKWLINWGEPWALLPSNEALVFIDNHDTQRNSKSILTYKDSKLYKMAVAFMLAHPYGIPRVMSSFSFEDFNTGPPADKNQVILSPDIRADNTCGNGWVCEHRWREIYNMVKFRNAVNETKIESWWDNGNYQISFCRGNLGFIAINLEKQDLDKVLHVCLPAGVYCDVISGDLLNGHCTGKKVQVNQNGDARIQIKHDEFDGVLAIQRNVSE